jgi:hypothetical protein
MKDMQDRHFEIGDQVAYAHRVGNTAYLDIRVVTRIEGGKLYLNNSKVAINFPHRLLNVSRAQF